MGSQLSEGVVWFRQELLEEDRSRNCLTVKKKRFRPLNAEGAGGGCTMALLQEELFL